MLTKGLAYKVYWVGRYLERIDMTCRVVISEMTSGDLSRGALNDLTGGTMEGIVNYLKSNFEPMREDLRAFGDSRVISATESLGAVMEIDFRENPRQYIEGVIVAVSALAAALESQLFGETDRKSSFRQKEVDIE